MTLSTFPFDPQKLVPAKDSFLEKAIAAKQAQLIYDDKERRVIIYVASPGERREIYDDPEEQVRAEFWAELIHRYHYPPHRIVLEFPVPDRNPKDFADIVIFKDDERKAPYIVVECKRENIKPAEFNQAIEQAFGNGYAHKLRAEFIMVVAGATKRAFDLDPQYEVLERDKNVIADLPISYGQVPKFKFTAGGALDIAPVSKESLIAAIEKCHQTLWGGGRLSPPAAFGELCKLVFAKTCDEKETPEGQEYRFQIGSRENNAILASRIRTLYDTHRKRERDAGVFDETIKLPDEMISPVVSHLEGINLEETDLDTKGVAFERFMDEFFKGNFGQYFTPREVIQFCVEMFPPAKTDLVLDPACGSGGFLLHALDHIRREGERLFPGAKNVVKRYSYWHDFAAHNLYGIEINDEIARVAKMNMILHDDGHTNVIGEDALVKFERYSYLRAGFKSEGFDLILTNPPFGASVAFDLRPEIRELFPHLAYSEGANGKKSGRKNQKTEILFLERIHQFLRAGGRAAVVLPDGILTNSSLAYVRDYLLESFRLRAVISLPQTAFAHYGAGVKSSLVFLEKRDVGEVGSDEEEIFMAAPENIGYDATGRKTWKVLEETNDGFRREQLIRCDLFDARIVWERKGKDDKWFEGPRQVVPGTGLLGEYQKFCQNPQPFFV